MLGPCASGSLQPEIEPGHFVVCDQLVDRTYGREQTYFDGPGATHVSFADPYCPQLRRVAVDAVAAEGITVHDRGTVVVDPGSTVLDPGRVDLVPPGRLARGQHDPVPRGVPRP